MLDHPLNQHRGMEFYRSLPKVELHRHLEGSLRITTLMEIGRSHGFNFPNTGRLRELVQVGDEEEYSIENFLSKFQTLRMFYKSPEVINRVVTEAIADAAMDNVRYMELRFTPVALSRAENFAFSDVLDWVIAATERAEEAFEVKTRLIVSLNRHEPVEVAEEIVQLILERRDSRIVGLDLAGNEADFSSMPFLNIFRQARREGLHITIHAGEWGSAENISDAILYLGAERIGHGVRVLEDPQVTHMACERGIPFEVCMTSNYQSGVLPVNRIHPITKMMSSGLNVTINTDDPSISQITLGNEYRLACEELGMPLSTLRERVLAAAQAAFCSNQEKQALLASLTKEYAKFVH